MEGSRIRTQLATYFPDSNEIHAESKSLFEALRFLADLGTSEWCGPNRKILASRVVEYVSADQAWNNDAVGYLTFDNREEGCDPQTNRTEQGFVDTYEQTGSLLIQKTSVLFAMIQSANPAHLRASVGAYFWEGELLATGLIALGAAFIAGALQWLSSRS